MDKLLAVHDGAEAWTRLTNHRFLQQWQGLYEQCPWATPYQSPAFAITWFDSYRTLFTPVIVCDGEGDGCLSGLLCLATSLEDGQLVVAGAHQAEYHAWLADPSDGGRFMSRALKAVLAAYPDRDLTFRFLPAEVPLEEIKAFCAVFPRAAVSVRRRPLLRVDRAELDESLRKKSNKSRFNRIKALGAFEFTRITSAEHFSAVFDEIIELYDFGQGAAHGVVPFQDDPLKKPFHLAMMAKHPGLLHVTLMTVGQQPVAAHLGIAGKGTVHLAIIAYSPLYAKHSPAKLLLMLLQSEFLREGVTLLDLTPGDDPWKERFANAHDQVYELVLHKSLFSRATRALRIQAGALARGAARRLGVTPEDVRTFGKRLARLRPKSVTRRLKHLAWERTELRIYRLEPKPRLAPQVDRARRDCLGDLLKYQPTEMRASREAFLAQALERMEGGNHVYTHAEENRLLHSGWLIERQEESLFTEVGERFRYPPGSAVLFDFYTHPEARSRGLYQSTLTQMFADVAKLDDVHYVYIAVLRDNAPSRHVIEKVGFTYQASVFRSRTLGRTKTWSKAPSGAV